MARHFPWIVSAGVARAGGAGGGAGLRAAARRAASRSRTRPATPVRRAAAVEVVAAPGQPQGAPPDRSARARRSTRSGRRRPRSCARSGTSSRQLEESLAKMINENTADVAIVAQQVEKVEKLRAEQRAARTVMIYRMRLLLTPEQRVKVDAIAPGWTRSAQARRRTSEEATRVSRETNRDCEPTSDRYIHLEAVREQDRTSYSFAPRCHRARRDRPARQQQAAPDTDHVKVAHRRGEDPLERVGADAVASAGRDTTGPQGRP